MGKADIIFILRIIESWFLQTKERNHDPQSVCSPSFSCALPTMFSPRIVFLYLTLFLAKRSTNAGIILIKIRVLFINF